MENKFYVKENGSAFQGIETVEKKSSKRPKVIFLFFLLLVLVGGLLYMGYQYAGLKQTKQKEVAAPTPTVSLIPTDTPVSTASGTPTILVTPKASAKITPTTTVNANTVKRSSISVSVLNGSGTPGAAGKVATFLKSLGYTISATGNADTFNYTNISLNVKKGDEAILSLLKSDLAKTYTLDSASATLPASDTTDAVVIVGK